MSLKQQLLVEVANSPSAVREMFADSDVLAALSSIGVLPKVLELHAPCDGARTLVGLGKTLCGINGTRHKIVTCERCKKKIGRSN